MELTKDEQGHLDRIRETYPDARPCRALGYFVILRPADGAEMDRYMDEVMGDNQKVKRGATPKLFRVCCVHPDKEAVGAMLGKRPGLALTFGKKAAELSGITDDCEMGEP